MKKTIIAAAFALFANSAVAGAITNGDFSSGLQGWNAQNSVYTSGSYAVLTATWANTYSSVSRSISLNAGDVFTGNARFQANDYLPYNDWALVQIDGVTLFSSNIAAVGNYGSTPLTSFEFVAPTTGVYNFWAGVANAIDSAGASQLLIGDLAVVESEVPEPASVALLGLGLLGAFAARRRTKA